MAITTIESITAPGLAMWREQVFGVTDIGIWLRSLSGMTPGDTCSLDALWARHYPDMAARRSIFARRGGKWLRRVCAGQAYKYGRPMSQQSGHAVAWFTREQL